MHALAGTGCNATLLSLNLNSNKLGNLGAHALQPVVSGSRALMELELSNNDIHTDGGEGLLAALEEGIAAGSPLSVLDLSANAFGRATRKLTARIDKALERNVTRRRVMQRKAITSKQAHFFRNSTLTPWAIMGKMHDEYTQRQALTGDC